VATNRATLKAQLPRFEQPPDYQTKIEEMKNHYQALDASGLAREFGFMRKMKRDLEEQVRDYNVHLEALSQLLVETLEASQQQSFKLLTGESVHIHTETYPSVQDKTLLMAWIHNSGLEELLSVNFRVMQSLVRERLQQGKELPPGVVAYLKTSARLTGGSNDQE
jgi:hypothetical protein